MGNACGQNNQPNINKRIFTRLIEAIESLSCDQDKASIQQDNSNKVHEKWSEEKIQFMRKYGHMR
ncbi:hypothetical protein CWI42_041930 [Ordospora colligata]|uniref:Uncharacterized protein n=1 Tax=Ordospora colligata OC4 TaxID=1354746 RepID=A0A0B2UL32_9MICR|nr:uncharacterized protein M896_041940 [Ordospora colligata OC4]KHN69994.1 hypothetical protein M896_041940 [Ordospora colligata OC4]TBU16164.1 hypothetical protein CWI41_041930 [Ordospora colligata]TBU16377.1 hypothetical protein CWI40_041930 [Ordospora colligata]TBU19081.1 hypothetical protein CWI42_041930 [Ordospora colligata]